MSIEKLKKIGLIATPKSLAEVEKTLSNIDPECKAQAQAQAQALIAIYSYL